MRILVVSVKLLNMAPNLIRSENDSISGFSFKTLSRLVDLLVAQI